MSKLPPLTARKVVRALKRAGFVEDRQRGSHLILIHLSAELEPWCPFIPAGPSRDRCSAPLFEMRICRSKSSSSSS